MIITDKGEIVYSKILNLWEEPDNYTKQDVLDLIYEVAEDIKKYGSKLGKETMEYIRKERLELNLCPECGSTLHTESQTINSHLIWGAKFEESETIAICDCGWSSKNE